MSWFRRRQMMSVGGGDPYIDWLKSLGCVVWLPLSEEGDLQDRISGESLQLSGKGSMTWVASQNMYKIYTPNIQFQYVALLSNGLTKDMFPNDCYTTMSTFKKKTNGDNAAGCQFAPLSTDDNTIVSMNPMYNVSINTSNFPTYEVKLARTETSSGRYFYQQGELYDTRDVNTSILPYNWVQDNSGLMLGMVRRNDNYHRNREFYIKDIYIFNTKLTLEQIRKIQGYE